ncbi:MAG: HAMP domain-containing histidine kinase [Deltaproteobacteria bacterium]|nr:HAMP domain-containing histidine kinase [Deltaproteobacteria bacterium]
MSKTQADRKDTGKKNNDSRGFSKTNRKSLKKAPESGKKKSRPEKPRAVNANQKEDWIQAVAHDLRSPLSIIHGYAEYLLSAERDISSEGKEVIERLRKVSSRSLSLLNKFLTLSRIEEGTIRIKGSATNLETLCERITELLKEKAEEKRITFTVRVESLKEDPVVDEFKLERILENLLSNAVKFSPSGSTVDIEAIQEPGKITFHIQDQGEGLNEEQAKQVFDKFTRFSSDDIEGSGLGLAIAKALTELHGGQIWVNSTPGRGARFSFYVEETSAT